MMKTDISTEREITFDVQNAISNPGAVTWQVSDPIACMHGLTSSVPTTSLAPPSPEPNPDMDPASESALKNHMGKYPVYFDPSFAEDERVPWALSNLSRELASYNVKRLQFEADKRKWEENMEDLRAKKLCELRKEVVRLWIRRQETQWAESRIKWEGERTRLEESMRTELMQLREADNQWKPKKVVPKSGAWQLDWD